MLVFRLEALEAHSDLPHRLAQPLGCAEDAWLKTLQPGRPFISSDDAVRPRACIICSARRISAVVHDSTGTYWQLQVLGRKERVLLELSVQR